MFLEVTLFFATFFSGALPLLVGQLPRAHLMKGPIGHRQEIGQSLNL